MRTHCCVCAEAARLRDRKHHSSCRRACMQQRAHSLVRAVRAVAVARVVQSQLRGERCGKCGKRVAMLHERCGCVGRAGLRHRAPLVRNPAGTVCALCWGCSFRHLHPVSALLRLRAPAAAHACSSRTSTAPCTTRARAMAMRLDQQRTACSSLRGWCARQSGVGAHQRVRSTQLRIAEAPRPREHLRRYGRRAHPFVRVQLLLLRLPWPTDVPAVHTTHTERVCVTRVPLLATVQRVPALQRGVAPQWRKRGEYGRFWKAHACEDAPHTHQDRQRWQAGCSQSADVADTHWACMQGMHHTASLRSHTHRSLLNILQRANVCMGPMHRTQRRTARSETPRSRMAD
jgi:hypothetical protein